MYLPDKGRDFTGGVGDPTASYVASDGTTSTGQAACTALQTKPGAYNLLNVNPILFPESKIKQLLTMSNSPEHPADRSRGLVQVLRPDVAAGPVLRRHRRREHGLELPLTDHRARGQPRERVRVHLARSAVRARPQRP